jgi:hypothetical protein
MSIELERRLRQLEARVDELLRSLAAEAAAREPAPPESQPTAANARPRDGNGRFVKWAR